MKRWVVFIIILTYNCFSFYGQNQITFRNLSVTDGLSQNSVVDMVQDSLGYLWMATQDGLNRYDGREFKTYPYQFLDITRPNFNRLGQLYVDREGTLWAIPLDEKLHYLSKNSTAFQKLGEITNVYSIYQDKKLNHWVGTHHGEIFIKSHKDTIFHQHLKGTFGNEPILQILQDTNDENFIVTQSKVVQYDYSTKKVLMSWELDQNDNASFSKLAIRTNGNLIVATYGAGLLELTPNNTSLEPLDWNIPNSLKIVDLFFDSRDRIWIGTYGQGLYSHDFTTGNTRNFKPNKTDNRSIHYNDILSIYEDYLGTVWFGTDGAGVSYYDEFLEKFNSKTNNQTSENIHVDVVRSITTGYNGKIWIGTSGKGLTSYNPKTDEFNPYSEQLANLPSNRIMSLFYDESNLWVGTQGKGVWVLTKEGKIVNPDVLGLNLPALNTVWSIYKDNDQNLWLGTRDNGLLKINLKTKTTEQFVYNSSENSIPSNNVRVITSDNNSNIWLGTENDGIAKLNPVSKKIETFSTSSLPYRLATNSIKSLLFDQNKNSLFVGTNGNGLNILDFNTQTTKSITVEQGLANNVIYAILPDANHNLWLSSNKGISQLSWSTNSALPQITNYHNYDGLATEFNTGAWHKSESGDIFFGGLDGFYWFNPSEIKTNKKLPKTQITSFKVDNIEYSLNDQPTLFHDQNTVSFTFSSMQFSLPAKNQYQYRLLNYDENWISAGNNNFARYTKLPPSDYTFQVKSSNYDGIWSPKAAQFQFTIKSPWYWNAWSKLIYLLLALGLIYILYRYLKWRWKMKMDLQFKEQETIRLQKLNDYKTKLYTNIAHEFKTPLTLITSPIDELISSKETPKDLDNTLQFVDRSVGRLTNLVDQLLQLAQLEEGKYSKKPQHGDLGLFIKNLIASYQPKAKEKSIALKSNISKMPWVWYDEDMVEKVLGNLLSNAIKYAPNDTDCIITSTFLDNKLKVEVSNKFLGEIDTSKVFNRFYRENSDNNGVGVGLSLVKELVAQFKGSVEAVKSNHLLTFRVHWLVDQSVFTEEELSKTPTPIKNPTLKASVEQPKDDKRLLLLVEDDSDTLEYMVSSLQNDYDLLVTQNGQEGLNKALSKIPDIIISDIKMPIMNGLELCGALKNDQRTSHIPIVLLTANSNELNQAKALELGAEAFVPKPFKIQQIKHRLENILINRKRMAEYFSDHGLIDSKTINSTPVEEAFIKKVKEIIDEQLTNTSFSAGEMATLIGLSRMQLHRKLQAYTGLSTSAFIRSQRLKLATELLTKTDQTVNEVAYAVGFNTPDYFMKCFKAQYQLTPTEFMSQYK